MGGDSLQGLSNIAFTNTHSLTAGGVAFELKCRGNMVEVVAVVEGVQKGHHPWQMFY